MSVIAGWSNVVDHLHLRLSFWFGIAFLAESAALGGYVLAYRAVATVEGGPRLRVLEAVELVAVGFGAFLAKGGAALDSKALRSRGGSKREGEVRVLALDALEHAPLAPAACAAAITLLVQGRHKPGLDFTIPWATFVPVGAVLAFIGVRHRQRFVGKEGWRGKLGDVLDGIRVLFRLGWSGAPIGSPSSVRACTGPETSSACGPRSSRSTRRPGSRRSSLRTQLATC